MEIKIEEVIDMNSWWKQKVIHQLKVLAWIDCHFKERIVQDVINYGGDRSTDSCNDYYHLIDKVKDAGDPSFYIDSSSIQHETIGLLGQYIMLKVTKEVEVMKQLKKEKIAKLQKELKELEG